MNAWAVAAALAIRYLSEEWAEAALRVVETDASVRDALRGTPMSLLTIILHPPDGCYGFLYAAFDASGLAEYRVGHDYDAVMQGIDPPTFVVSGLYDVFAEIQRGGLSARRAIASGKLHLTGPWTKAIRRLRALETITAVLSSIDCET